MPSNAARQRNRRNLASTPSTSQSPLSRTSSSDPSRLRRLLSLLLVSTTLLLLLHFYRASQPQRSQAFEKAWDAASKNLPPGFSASSAKLLDRIGLGQIRGGGSQHTNQVEGAGGFNPPGLAPVPGQGVRDHPVEGSTTFPTEGMADVKVDQEALSELDPATLKAMFDALYGEGGPLAKEK